MPEPDALHLAAADPNDGTTELQVAICAKDLNSIEKCLDTDPFSALKVNQKGETAMHFAVYTADENIISLLLSHPKLQKLSEEHPFFYPAYRYFANESYRAALSQPVNAAEKALNELLNAIKNLECITDAPTNKDCKLLGKCYAKLAEIRSQKNQKDFAIHYNEAIDVCKKMLFKDEKMIHWQQKYLGELYDAMGQLYQKLHKTPRAIAAYEKSLYYFKSISSPDSDDQTALSNSYHDLGLLYASQKDSSKKAIDYIKKSIDIVKDTPFDKQNNDDNDEDYRFLMRACFSLAVIYDEDCNNLEMAIETDREALKYDDKIKTRQTEDQEESEQCREHLEVLTKKRDEIKQNANELPSSHKRKRGNDQESTFSIPKWLKGPFTRIPSHPSQNTEEKEPQPKIFSP